MSSWIVVLCIAAGSYAIRASMFVALAGRPVPAWLAQRFDVVGPAAIGALLASYVLGHRDQAVSLVVAGLGAFVATRRTGNLYAALVVGMPLVWATQWL
jgi:branched-subunit amino acid transport protein